jgi:hypothetical protein
MHFTYLTHFYCTLGGGIPTKLDGFKSNMKVPDRAKDQRYLGHLGFRTWKPEGSNVEYLRPGAAAC